MSNSTRNNKRSGTVKSLIVLLLAIITSSVTSYSQVSADDLNLKGAIAEKYDQAIIKRFIPENYQTGDSIYNIGIKRSQNNVMVAGIILKSMGGIGKGDTEGALKDTEEGIRICENEPELSKAYYYLYTYNINILMMTGKMHEMLEKSQEMMNAASVNNDVYGLSYSYYCMGLTFTIRDNPRLAEQYFSKAAEISEKNDIEESLKNIYLNLANCYSTLNDTKKTLKIIDKLHEIARKSDNETSKLMIEAYILSMAFNVYSNSKYIEETDKIIKTGVLESLDSEIRHLIMSMYYCGKRIKSKALQHADSLNTGVNSLNTKEQIYSFLGDWKEAYKCRVEAVMYHDSIQTIIQNEDIAALESEMGNVALRANAQKLEEKNRQILFGSVLFIVIATALLIAFYYITRQRSLEKQKAELQLEVERQTSELRKKNALIERASRETTDSINYAKRIQNAILPDLSQLTGNGIAGVFTVMRPYNIVSGDFYWAKTTGDKIVIVCADCTGHGVPGAFMSMIGSALLGEICSQPQLPSAGEILTELDKQTKEMLGQNKGQMLEDGMDLAIVIYEPKTFTLSYSTAKRPIYLVQDGNIIEYKGIKRSIGDNDEKSCKLPFETSSVHVFPGDTLYMCSDGVADQFGGQETYGPNGKRLRTNGLKRIFSLISALDINKQKEAFDKQFDSWKGTCKQVDDISLIGIRF